MQTRRSLLGAAPLATALFLAQPILAYAQAYPVKPVKIVVPYPAGGSMDLVARLLAEPMSKSFGQPFVVENRPGAAGQVASAFVARAEPDGYTLLVTNPGPSAVSLALNPKLPYHPVNDFAPVSLAGEMPMVISVGSGSRFQGLADLVAAAKAQPGKLNFASTGNGSLSHVIIESFNAAAGIKATHIPYKGGAEISTAAITGDVDYFVSAASDVVGLVKSGKLRAIATTGAQRSMLMPTVPTVSETGRFGFEVVYWIGLVAPAKTPAPVIDALNHAVVAIMTTTEMKTRMARVMTQASSSTAAALQSRVEADVARWTKVVKAADIKVE